MIEICLILFLAVLVILNAFQFATTCQTQKMLEDKLTSLENDIYVVSGYLKGTYFLLEDGKKYDVLVKTKKRKRKNGTKKSKKCDKGQ